MKKTLIISLLLTFYAFLLANVKVVNKNLNSYTVKFNTGNYQIESDKNFNYITGSNLSYANSAGQPNLPSYSQWVIVPPNGNLSIEILTANSKNIKLTKPFKPVPTIVKGKKTDEYLYKINQQKYTETTKLINQTNTFTWRGYSVVELQVNPFILNKNNLNVYKQIEFKINLKGSVNYNSKTSSKNLNLLSSQFLNPEKLYTYKHSPKRTTINYADFSKASHWYKFEVNKNGIHQLTYSSLSSLPLADIDPNNFRIFTNDGAVISLDNDDNEYKNGKAFTEIPILVEGSEDGSFDSGDKIIFYAEQRDTNEKNKELIKTYSFTPNSHLYNPWSKNGVYWLCFSANFPNPPKRLETEDLPESYENERNTHPFKSQHELELIRESQFGYNWFEANFAANSSHNYTVAFENYLPSEQLEPVITFNSFRRLAYNDSGRITVTVNNLATNTTMFDSNLYFNAYSANNGFTNGNNNIRFTTTKEIWFNYYTVEYPQKMVKLSTKQKQFNIYSQDENKTAKYNLQLSGSNPNLKVWKVNSFNNVKLCNITSSTNSANFVSKNSKYTKYHVTNSSNYYSVLNFEKVETVDLTNQSQAVDCIIIYPSALKDQALELADLHYQAYQVNSKAVDIQDIYNQFNAGMPDPAAIRLFLQYASQNYPNQGPIYCTLYGSGTFDWRNYSGNALTKNKLPLFIAGSKIETPSDDYFAYFTNEMKPEMAIGRIPAQTTSMAKEYNKKFKKYTQNTESGKWQNKLLILADDQYHSSGASETSHTTQARDTKNSLNKNIYADVIWSIEHELDQFRNKPQVRDTMVDKINDGVLMWYYIGHGAHDLIGDEDYFRSPGDLPLLKNYDHLPLFIAASCEVGQSSHFSFDSLAEQLLFLPDGGAIASMAASMISSGPSNTSLMRSFYNQALNNSLPLGIALMNAKPDNNAMNSRVYHIFGDPVLQIIPPKTTENITASKSSLMARQKASFSGKFSNKISGTAEVFAYSPEMPKEILLPTANDTIFIPVNYSKNGKELFKGKAKVEDGNFDFSFFVPEDINQGQSGKIISYITDETNNKTYTSFLGQLTFSGTDYSVTDNTPPNIKLLIDSENFRNGDIVSTNPVLIAEIEDNSGINLMGKDGHKIIININGTTEITDVTSYFTYDEGSATKGKLVYQLPEFEEGSHNIQIIAFDNFNNPAAAEANFVTKATKGLAIEQMLVYPNPVKNKADFTFILTQDANITIKIFTITGKKINTIKAIGEKGYNQIYWNGKDADGDKLANNTYFWKVIAKNANGSKEKTSKLIILK